MDTHAAPSSAACSRLAAYTGHDIPVVSGPALATNQLGEALYLGFGVDASRPRNMARFVFLDPRAPDLFVDWERSGRDCVGMLRYSAGRHPDDRQLNELIGALSVRSPEFRRWWADHNVRKHSTGTKHFHHPIVGDLTVGFESLHVGDNLDQNLVAYTVEPNSRSAEALGLLASWAATPTDQEATSTGDRATSPADPYSDEKSRGR